jgi:DNA-binding beta-propeller fold protein YncE
MARVFIILGCLVGAACVHRDVWPLQVMTEVALPGAASRFDYQDVDLTSGRLLIAHMGGGEVLVVNLADGVVRARLPGLNTPRGVLAAPELGRYFVTSLPNELVAFDSSTFAEVGRFSTGAGPDGLAFDPTTRVVAVSAQRAGAVTLLPSAGSGVPVQVPLGEETGNVQLDAPRARFWVTVVRGTGADQLVSMSPTGEVFERVELPGCEGAHGLRLHPDGQSLYVACEGNSVVLRVDLQSHAVVSAAVGRGPDVMAVDATAGLLYVAAESGDLVVFDTHAPGLVVLDREHVASAAHSVAVDPSSHRVFFPLEAGPAGTPMLRVMRPGVK